MGLPTERLNASSVFMLWIFPQRLYGLLNIQSIWKLCSSLLSHLLHDMHPAPSLAMPTLPIWQWLLQGAFNYARKLQELHHCATVDPNSNSNGSSNIKDPQSLGSDNSDSDIDSLPSSLSLISSLLLWPCRVVTIPSSKGTQWLKGDCFKGTEALRRLSTPLDWAVSWVWYGVKLPLRQEEHP